MSQTLTASTVMSIKLPHRDIWEHIIRRCHSEDWLSLYLTGDRITQQLLLLTVKSSGDSHSRYYPLLKQFEQLEELSLYDYHDPCAQLPQFLSLPVKLQTLTLRINIGITGLVQSLPATVTRLAVISTVFTIIELAAFPLQLELLELTCHYSSHFTYQPHHKPHIRSALRSLSLRGLGARGPGDELQQAIDQLLGDCPSLTALNSPCQLSTTLAAIKNPALIQTLEIDGDYSYLTVISHPLISSFTQAQIIIHCTESGHGHRTAASSCGVGLNINKLICVGKLKYGVSEYNPLASLPDTLTSLTLYHTSYDQTVVAPELDGLTRLTHLNINGFTKINVPSSVTELCIDQRSFDCDMELYLPPGGCYRKLLGISMDVLTRLQPAQLADLTSLAVNYYPDCGNPIDLLHDINPRLRELAINIVISESCAAAQLGCGHQVMVTIVKLACNFPWLRSLKICRVLEDDDVLPPQHYHRMEIPVILPPMLEELHLECNTTFEQVTLPTSLTLIRLIHTDFSDSQLSQLAGLPLRWLEWCSVKNRGKINQLFRHLPATLTKLDVEDYLTADIELSLEPADSAVITSYVAKNGRHLKTLIYNSAYWVAIRSPGSRRWR